jgi:hypothetical protein
VQYIDGDSEVVLAALERMLLLREAGEPKPRPAPAGHLMALGAELLLRADRLEAPEAAAGGTGGAGGRGKRTSAVEAAEGARRGWPPACLLVFGWVPGRRGPQALRRPTGLPPPQ